MPGVRNSQGEEALAFGEKGIYLGGGAQCVHSLIPVFLYSSIQQTFTEPFLCSRQKNPCPQRTYVLVVETDNKQD